MANAAQYGLGRIEEFDEASREFPVRALVGGLAPRSYTWSCGPRLNQGQEGTCVGFAWAQEFSARPAVRPVTNFTGRLLYREAVKLDQWPQNDGPDYNFGTSVIAGAKVCKELGWITEYRWAFSIDDLKLAVGYEGPAVLGIPWYSSMFDPNPDGLVTVSGAPSGGHAIICNGYNVSRKLFRLHNSWGPDWGIDGECFISDADLARLLREGGEACIPIGRK